MTIYAAKVLAAAAAELIDNPELLRQAKEEHAKRIGPDGYNPPIPRVQSPLHWTACGNKVL